MSQLKQNGSDLDVIIAMANALSDRGDTLEDLIVSGEFSGDYVNNRVKHIGFGRFGECDITSCTFLNATSASERAFFNCSSLITVNVPKLKAISGYMFYNCDALSSVCLPEVVTIGSYGFYSCGKLSTVDLPNATMLNAASLAQCIALEKLILRSSTVVTLGAITALQATKIASGKGYVYVPNNLVEDYKTATNWTTYANWIRSIDELEEA